MAKKPVKKIAKKPVMKKKAAPAKKAVSAITKKAAPIQAPVKTPPPPKWKEPIRPKNANTLSYTQSEFVESVKGFCGMIKRSEARELCEDLARLVKESLKRGYKIPLFGLGKLYVRQTKARTGRNPATGQLIQIPAKKRVRFVATKALKEAVLK